MHSVSFSALFAATVVVLSSSTTLSQRQEGFPFKVATWNVRSGMGIPGFNTTWWTGTTTNCTDRSKPVNAWGVGLPQKSLEQIKADQSIVALAIQEAWHCGSPENVNSVLNFKTASREQEGV